MEQIVNPNPLVNEVVKKLLFERRQTAPDLADGMTLSNDSTYKLLRRSDWRISEMREAGRFLGVNLFELFVPAKTTEVNLSSQLKAKQSEMDAKEKEMSELKQKTAMLEMENKYLKELVEMAKMKLKH